MNWCAAMGMALVAACAPQDPGPDFMTDLPEDSGPRVPSGGALSPDFFFCVIQPTVFNAHRCATAESGCHTTRTGFLLDPAPERAEPLVCRDGVPQGSVPPAYYTNLARARNETRATADSSDLLRRPLGRSHPVTLFDASSAEANALRRWIEGP